MIYDYEVYYMQNCSAPLTFAAFSLFLLIGTLGGLIFACFSKNKENCPRTATDIAKLLLFFGLIIFLMSNHLVVLFRGGIYLLWEKETDQIQVSGKIEETMEIDAYTGVKYGTENNHGRGEVIVVNGKKSYLTTYGDFGVGDDVILNVLPRSGFVLKMERASETPID